MGGPIKHRADHTKVPYIDVQPAVEKLIANYGGKKPAARALTLRYPERSWAAWDRVLYRIEKNESGNGRLRKEIASQLFEAANMEPPATYRQRLWKVSGLTPWPERHRKKPGFIEHWYYIRKGSAKYRVEYLKERGLFVECAYTDTVWRVVDRVV